MIKDNTGTVMQQKASAFTKSQVCLIIEVIVTLRSHLTYKFAIRAIYSFLMRFCLFMIKEGNSR